MSLIRFLPYMALIALVIGVFFYAYKLGRDKERALCELQKTIAIDENIEIRKKQDKILRPNDAAYIDSLQSGTF